MAKTAVPDFLEFFSSVRDPRVTGRCLHPLENVLFIAVCGALAGCDGPDEMALFAELHQEWFATYIDLQNGLPSHDTISRVFNLIKPEEFAQALYCWVISFLPGTAAERAAREHLIAIDGKSLRGSARPSQGLKALHLLNVWSVSYQVSLGVRPVAEKSSEIPELPHVLRSLDLEGATVTIDAMGTQKEVAETIVEGGGDYVLALKNNHPTLCQEVTEIFDAINSRDLEPEDIAIYRTTETAHGRHEERTYGQIALPQELTDYTEEWAGLQSIGYADSVVTRDGKEQVQVRLYISSLPVDVERFARCVRGHWQIENTLHWTLDMTLSEDRTTTYLRRAATNFAALRRLIISILKQNEDKGSLKSKRRRAGWNLEFLEKLLFLVR